MTIPSILCRLLIWHIFFGVHIDVRLLSFPEEIFTKQIKDSRNTLVGVVLVIALKLRGILA
jgi:hypothetical protein